jgi:hypothetical protein
MKNIFNKLIISTYYFNINIIFVISDDSYNYMWSNLVIDNSLLFNNTLKNGLLDNINGEYILFEKRFN